MSMVDITSPSKRKAEGVPEEAPTIKRGRTLRMYRQDSGSELAPVVIAQDALIAQAQPSEQTFQEFRHNFKQLVNTGDPSYIAFYFAGNSLQFLQGKTIRGAFLQAAVRGNAVAVHAFLSNTSVLDMLMKTRCFTNKDRSRIKCDTLTRAQDRSSAMSMEICLFRGLYVQDGTVKQLIADGKYSRVEHLSRLHTWVRKSTLAVMKLDKMLHPVLNTVISYSLV